MFTGLVATWASSSAWSLGRAARASRSGPPRSRRRARPRREHRLLGRCLTWSSAAAGASSVRRRPGDARAHDLGDLAPRHAGEPGAGARGRRPARRPPRGRPRGRRGRGPRARGRRGRARGSRSRSRAPIAPLVAEKGSIAVDGVSLTVAPRAPRPLRDRAHPGDARAHDARRGGGRDEGESGGGRRWRATSRACASSGARRRPPNCALGLAARGTDSEGSRAHAVERVERRSTHFRARQDDDPRRRRGPRERGRSRACAAEKVTPEADQLHGEARARPHLPRARPRSRSDRSGCRSWWTRPRTPHVRHRVHRIDRGRAAASPPASAQRTARTPSATAVAGRRDARRTSRDRATCSRSAPAAGGVLVRAGQTEGSVDLARLAGHRSPPAVICEVMNDDGSMARLPELERLAAEHDLPIVSIADLIALPDAEGHARAARRRGAAADRVRRVPRGGLRERGGPRTSTSRS